MSQKVTFVIFGGTGDLTKRKLVPAFASLLHDKVLCDESLIIGIARGDFTNETYRDLLIKAARNEDERKLIEKVNIQFYRKDSTQPGALHDLKSMIECGEGCPHNRIFYLATGYNLFPAITKNLHEADLIQKSSKIVFEKPFGKDLHSAEALEAAIHQHFTEDMIYRIDHYLGKETVQNLNVLKFTNPFLESLLSNKHIKSVEVIADEDLGVGSRLGYYTSAGAVKDMIQSHLLQVLALFLMDKPESLDPKHIHDAKVSVLKSLQAASSEKHIFGQYESLSSELKMAGMESCSIETFARVVCHSALQKWSGVDLVMQTGKMLDKKYGKIVVHFKKIGDDFAHSLHGIQENKMVIDIHPTENIQLFFNTRKRFSKDEIEQVKFDFCGDCVFGPNTTDGYKRLISDILKGDHTLFTREDELKESWRIVDDIENIRDQVKLVTYKDGSNPDVIR